MVGIGSIIVIKETFTNKWGSNLEQGERGMILEKIPGESGTTLFKVEMFTNENNTYSRTAYLNEWEFNKEIR